MNSLLPILVGLQQGANAIGEAGTGKEPLGQVIQDQANPSGNTFARAFSQVFREQEESSPLFNQLQPLVSTPTQRNGVPYGVLTQKDSFHLEALVRPDVAERTLSESPANRPQVPPEVSLLPISASDTLGDPVSPLSAKALEVLFSDKNESVSERGQVVLPKEFLSPVGFLTTTLTPLEGFQASARVLFEGSRFQSSGGQLAPGFVGSDLARESEFLGKAPVPLPKVLEPGLTPSQVPVPRVLESGLVPSQVPLSKVSESGWVPPQVHQGQSEKQHSSLLNGEGESLTRSSLSSVKDVPSGQVQVGRSVPEDEALRFPTLQRFSNQPARSQNVLSNQAPHVTAPQAEGPVGFTEHALGSQSPINPIPCPVKEDGC